ncbi:hypothetical protein C2G38_2230354 [Gigaspora rosea]|uniref:Nuclear pore complex protein Nup85 n=1 Tax=Gigaspora rosea TaxID=44941 RepID=A0A397TU94_9GLOM|nr:hypothetical protein C2G38_2230354 [Gigaspora rosea]
MTCLYWLQLLQLCISKFYAGEWKRIVANSETWLSKEINNVDAEDRLYSLCKTFIIERFKPKLPLLIESLSLSGIADEFLQYLRKYFKTERVSKLHQNVWVTACVVWYLRLVAVDHRHEWIANYEQSSEWLTKQFNGDTSLEKEIYECARILVVSRYEVETYVINADNSFVAAIKTKDAAIEEEKNELKRQKKDCEASWVLGKTSLEAVLRRHFISDNLSKLDNDTLLTAVATWYLRLLAVDHIPHWATVCDASYKWSSSQIKNPQIERELLGSAKKFVIRGYNVDDDTLEEDDGYQGNLELYLRDLKKHDKIMTQSNIIEYFFV